jgi:DNA-binding helix-hairpin-helix protein with protein kinase domain
MHAVKIGGRAQPLGKKIGQGGEGEVFVLGSAPDRAVKLYKDIYRAQREAKIRAMVACQLATATDLIAFPAEIVEDLNGRFAGFVMRLVSGYQPIHELYGPKSRKLHFPTADYRFLVRTAVNVARAVGTVHQAGCVIGDFNHSGVLVAQDATVALIDADSFQFSADGRVFHCEVGVPDFTPPELHGTHLASVLRTPAHDHFGLAVAIFHLLAMGKHPYAGRFAGGDLSMSEAIAQNRFAFSTLRQAETRTTPPPGSVALQDFPAPVLRAFEAAFGLAPALRPDPAQWIAVLKDLEPALRRCTAIDTHFYPTAAGGCVWCRLSAESGYDMFPDMRATEPPKPAEPIAVKRAWVPIRAVKLPTPKKILPVWVVTPRLGRLAVAKARLARMWRRLVGAVALAAAAAGRWRWQPGIVASATVGIGLLLAAVGAAVWIGVEAVRGP